MAKNKYRKYEFKGTFTCGHTATIEQGGYTREYAENIADSRFEDEKCPECTKKDLEVKHKKEAEEAKKEAEEMGFPELEGTPKQVQWAESLRKEMLEEIISFIKDMSIDDTILMIDENKQLVNFIILNREEFEKFMQNEDFIAYYDYLEKDEQELEERAVKELKNNLINAVIDMFKDKILASFYIDQRAILERYYNYGSNTGYKESFIIDNLDESYYPKTDELEFEKELEDEIEKEQTVVPENYNQSNCEIQIKDRFITLSSPKNQEIIDFVKSKKYYWRSEDKVWIKPIYEEEKVNERVAELGNKLLNLGFAVKFSDFNKEVQRKAIDGDFEKENTRTVRVGLDEKDLYLGWSWSERELYKEAKRINGARWDKSSISMLVPIKNYKEVLDFANTNDFFISDAAKKAIDEYKEALEEKKVKVSETKEDKKKVKSMLEDFDPDLLEDLKDD